MIVLGGGGQKQAVWARQTGYRSILTSKFTAKIEMDLTILDLSLEQDMCALPLTTYYSI